jgi:methionyl-tRNA formyltransferase
MDAGMDTGDIILQRPLAILPEDGFLSLHDRMAALSCDAILEALALIEGGTARRTPQDSAAATYAPLIKKADGLLDWDRDAGALVNQARALSYWPGVYTFHAGQLLKMFSLSLAPAEGCGAPGTVLGYNERGLVVRTRGGAVSVGELQGEGGKRMPAADFLRGRPIKVGTVLG